MEKYEKYKDSGIAWIGMIPEHWEVKKLGWLGYFTSSGIDKKINAGETMVNMINYTNIYGNNKMTLSSDMNLMVVSCPKSKIKEHQIKKGDLLFTPSSETIEDLGLSAVVIDEMNNTVFSYHIIRFEFKELFDLQYKKYLCNNYFVLNQFSKEAKGTTRQILGRDVFKKIEIVYPSLDEQTAIAVYLDRKTAEIDRIIATKQKLIALYEEEKQAIINQAVTKGVKTHGVRLKDSGVEWLGEIPEHWIIKKLKHITEVKDGTHDTPDYVTESENSIPLITSKDITSNCIDFSDCKHIAYEDYLIINNRSNVTFNDIIMPMIGTVGGAVIVDTNRPFSIKNVALFKTSEINCNVKYIKFFIDSEVIKKQFEIESRGGVQNFVSLSLLRNLYAFDVPKVEQDAIVTYIENESNNINLLIEKFTKQIALLQEYRTTLISEVVTGKIMVPENENK